MLVEIELQAGYLKGAMIETIYFGGGTPSAIPAEDIEKLLSAIQSIYPLSPMAEITLEANPEDIHTEKLRVWTGSGINRLSIGVQSFQDEILAAWNRSHSGEQALTSIQLAQSAGITNITADLIYGGPGLGDQDWMSNIKMLVDSDIPHISCYALTVERGTALHHHIHTGKTKSPDDDQANRQYGILQKMMQEYGFRQYEVSNFAKPGFESKHNSSYWHGVHYLGIGPAAHSFDGNSRQWNVAHNVRYIQKMQEKEIPFEKEILTHRDRYNEMVMTGLRTSAGIDLNQIQLLGNDFEKHLLHQLAGYLEEQKLMMTPDRRMVLRPEYYFFADGIASQGFMDDSS